MLIAENFSKVMMIPSKQASLVPSKIVGIQLLFREILTIV